MASRVKSQSKEVHWGQIVTAKTQGSNVHRWADGDYLCRGGGNWEAGGLNHMICQCLERRGGECGRTNGGGRVRELLKTASPRPHLLPVVVVADGGQSLAYCHSPLKGQWALLGGAGAKPLTLSSPLPSAYGCVYVYAHRRGRLKLCDQCYAVSTEC